MITDRVLLIIGKGTALTLAFGMFIAVLLWVGWFSVYVVERYSSYIGVHREVLYFIRNRKELRRIIAKRDERRSVLRGITTKRAMKWGRHE